MKEFRKEFIDKATSQTFKSSDINAVDVMVWLFRHGVQFTALLPIFGLMAFIVWGIYFEPKVKKVAGELDKPIVKQMGEIKTDIGDLKKKENETFYIVKKMELVQNRTSPAEVVEDAEAEIEIEKIRGRN